MFGQKCSEGIKIVPWPQLGSLRILETLPQKLGLKLLVKGMVTFSKGRGYPLQQLIRVQQKSWVRPAM